MGNLRAAVEAIQAIDPRVPDVALILGSGLGSLADTASNMISIPGAEIPGFPAAGVSGHEGDLVIGDLAGKVVAFFRGRFHKYEGHDIATLTFPVRVAAALGIRRLIVTNAAGSLRPQTSAGSLMRITDHINTTAWDPLLGIKHSGTDNPARGRRPNDGCYDDEWGREADQLALDLGIKLYQGVYAWTLGPSYETPAEIRYFRKIGADAVGMSTVPEVSIASRLGVKVLGFSAITNLGAGLEDVVLSHADVLDVGRSIHGKMKQLLVAILASIPDRDAEPGHE